MVLRVSQLRCMSHNGTDEGQHNQRRNCQDEQDKQCCHEQSLVAGIPPPGFKPVVAIGDQAIL
jgi:hypothetical protein